MVVGAVGFEIYKFVNEKKVEKMRNCFCNLAIPLWVFSEPLDPIKMKDKDHDPILMGPVKAIPSGFTTWDKLVVQGPATLGKTMEYLKTEYKIAVSLISCGKYVLYNMYSGGAEQKLRLNMTPEQVVKQITGEDYPAHKKFVEMEIAGNTVDGDDCLTPSIKYIRWQE